MDGPVTQPPTRRERIIFELDPGCFYIDEFDPIEGMWYFIQCWPTRAEAEVALIVLDLEGR